jgi:disulfide bond formation protein DsbB
VTIETMRTFFALAALAANAITIVIIVAAIYGRAKRVNPFAALAGTTLWLAAGVAIFATLGSLYLSEIAHFIPCRLCWFQRIAMYPLAIILPIAAFRRDATARLYVVVLASIGAAIALYHRLMQSFPALDTGSCSAVGPSCASPLIKMYGFVTIPYMALSAFLLILAFMYVDRINSAGSMPTLRSPDGSSEATAT